MAALRKIVFATIVAGISYCMAVTVVDTCREAMEGPGKVRENEQEGRRESGREPIVMCVVVISTEATDASLSIPLHT